LLPSRLVRRTSAVDDQIDLLDVVLAGEHDAAGHYLAQGAARRPDIDVVAVLVGGEHDLGGAVVSCHDVLRQVLVPL